MKSFLSVFTSLTISAIFLNIGGTIKIFNGNKVKKFSDYPYMASVNFNNSKSLYENHDAGATFITQNFLLTAGHIVSDNNGNIINPNKIKIAYGGIDLKKESDFHIFKVKAVYRFYGYYNQKMSGTNLYYPNYDIGLIEIENHSSVKVNTVKLVDENNYQRLTKFNNTVRIIGWGFSEPFVSVSQYLRWSDMILRSNQETFHYLYTLDQFYWNTYDPNTMISSESKNLQRSTQGDSGGPELVYDSVTKQYIEVGVCSWSPDVPNTGWDFYARLSNPLFLEWIKEIVN